MLVVPPGGQLGKSGEASTARQPAINDPADQDWRQECQVQDLPDGSLAAVFTECELLNAGNLTAGYLIEP